MTTPVRKPRSIRGTAPILLLLCLATTAVSQKVASGSGIDAQKQLNELSALLADDSTATIEILHVPVRIETRAAITPAGLERLFYCKLTVRNIRDWAGRDELVRVMKSSTVTTEPQMPDLRWAIILYSSDERRIGALYFDRWGTKGAVGDHAISFGNSFSGWLKHTLPDSLQ